MTTTTLRNSLSSGTALHQRWQALAPREQTLVLAAAGLVPTLKHREAI